MENNMNAPKENKPASGMPKKSIKMPKNLNMFILGLVGFVVVLVVGLTVFGVVRAYVSQSTDGVTVAVAKILRLPAGKVNDQPILYSDYVSDLEAINVLSDWQAAQGGGPYAEMDDELLSDMVLEKLVGAAVVRQTARDLGAEVAEEDVQELLQYNISQFDSEEEFIQEIGNMYGWTLEDYIENALRPAALQLSIEDKVQENPDFLRQVRERMEGVLKELQDGADFAELAMKYSEDNTATDGGDLGWFGEGEMVPQFEEVAFALKPGEMSNALVESPYGLHIIKVDDRRTVQRENEDGDMEDAVEVKARHIFMAYPSASTYLRQQIDEAQIHIYGTLHDPFVESEESEEAAPENSEETTE